MSGIFKRIFEGVGNVSSRVASIGSTVTSAINSVVNSAVTRATTTINSALNSRVGSVVNSAINSAVTRANSVINSTASGFRSGLRTAAQTVLRAVSDRPAIEAPRPRVTSSSRFSRIPTGMIEVDTPRIGDIVQYLDESGVVISRRIHNRFYDITEGNAVPTTKSDQEFARLHDNSVAIRYLREENPKNTRETQNTGAWFPYFLKEDIPLDLTRYGIYKKSEFDSTDLDNCFTKIFNDRPEYDDLKTIVYGRYTRQSDIKLTVNFLNIVIKLHKYCGGKKDITTYAPKDCKNIKTLTVYEIGLLENHYFRFEPTQYKFSYITHKGWEKPFVVRSNAAQINSFSLIRILLERKEEFLDNFDEEILNTVYATSSFNPFLEVAKKTLNPEKDCMMKKEKRTEGKTEDHIVVNGEPYKFKTTVYADIETYSHYGRHCPYLFAIKIGETGETNWWWGNDCIKMALKYLSTLDNPLIYFHNLGYDSTFILDSLYKPESINTSGSRCICMKGWVNKKLLVFHDTLALVSAPLKNFAKMFNLPESKFEDFPYHLYTKETIEKKYIPDSSELSSVPSKYHKSMLVNTKNWKVVDHINYAIDYCMRDVEVLCAGFETFKGWIRSELDIDLDYSLTTASMAHKYMTKEGCYKGVAKIGGLTRLFIQSAVVGGRTTLSMNNDHKYQVKQFTKEVDPLFDLDAVSLYPSAMMRFDGCPIGKATSIENVQDRKWMNKGTAYFVQIQITKVGKKLKLPFISYKTETGRRLWENEIEGRVFVVDRYTLEDWIKYHEIEFTPIVGIEFLDGYNDQIVKTMKKLFQLRLKLKSEKNPAESVYKLIMNSAYGKTIEKPHFLEVKFIPKDKFDVFRRKNYGVIESFVEMENNFRVEVQKSIADHHTFPHVGSSILSMSKRIMAEVTSVADDCIYYTDTDSIFITQEGLNLLPETLVGTNPGQFHVDFAMKGTNVRAVEGLFLAPKTYCLKLTNDEGEEEYHIRMKGISDNAHSERVKEYDGDYLAMFRDMEHKTLSFDLLAGGKPRFEFRKNLSVFSLKQFTRKVGPFSGDKKDLDQVGVENDDDDLEEL